MNDESVFLRALLADPATRLAYADWLEERGDPRAQFLRFDPELDRINFVAWLERNGNLDYYVDNFAEVKQEAEQWKAAEQQRMQRRALGSALDPNWVTFINTLGCHFQPFFFFNNSSQRPHAFEPAELPFAEPIGTRGAVITFASDFRDPKSWDQGLMRDLRFLCQLELGECAYGAASCPVHPFVCELKAKQRPLVGSNILTALRPRDFQSRYIRNLDATLFLTPATIQAMATARRTTRFTMSSPASTSFRKGMKTMRTTRTTKKVSMNSAAPMACSSASSLTAGCGMLSFTLYRNKWKSSGLAVMSFFLPLAYRRMARGSSAL
jgi:uncharacterized protein (TIGR02996 family)